jgi:hypothetical protein
MRAINEEAPHPIGQLKRVSIRFGEVSPCADAGIASSTFDRRRSRAMPKLSMNTTKLMNPIVEIPAITDDAGLSSPNKPVSTPSSKPSQPIQRGSARVIRTATVYSGTTTPQPRNLPTALVTRARAAKVSAVAASVACPAGSAAM